MDYVLVGQTTGTPPNKETKFIDIYFQKKLVESSFFLGTHFMELKLYIINIL